MPEFLVKLGTPAGEIREEVIQADSESDLRQELAQKDHYVFNIRSRSALRLMAPRARKGRVKLQSFLVFNQEMVTLLRAGLPLLHCLAILLERMPESTLRTALEDVQKRIHAGESLSDAFSAQGEMFPRIYSSSLTAGERSGELDTVIERYVEYVKKLQMVRRKVGQAIVYPIVLLSVSIVVVGVLIFYAIPQFAGLYADFGSELPFFTSIVVGTSTFMLGNWYWIAAVLAGLVIGARTALMSPAGRMFRDKQMMRLPLVGEVAQKYAISEMSRTLSILLRGGIPLVTALDVASGAVGNTLVRARLQVVGTEVREGKALWESLEESGIMPDLALEMVKVGESTGSLDDMLHKISEFYDEEIDYRISTLVTLFEPAMLLIMGGIVIFLLLSMYLPIFQTISAINT